MKIKNKGKVYPSPSSSSSSSSSSSPSFLSFSPNGDYLSVLKLLPAAILALASVLSLEDREVLAYMITRSMKTTTTTTTTNLATNTSGIESKRKPSKKPSNSNNTHKPPVFDCDCFDCYRSYWFRWDSSPNRELIHQAIEAFEDHLANGESEKSKKNTRTKRRDKSGRRVVDKPVDVSGQPEIMPVIDSPETEEQSSPVFADVGLPGNDVSPLASPEKVNEEAVEVVRQSPEMVAEEEEMAVVVRTTVVAAVATSNHKGLARKVLPDVLGLFNSRLWSLWGPNV